MIDKITNNTDSCTLKCYVRDMMFRVQHARALVNSKNFDAAIDDIHAAQRILADIKRYVLAANGDAVAMDGISGLYLLMSKVEQEIERHIKGQRDAAL